MIIAGIDPGKRGAIVVIDTESTRACYEKLTYDKEGNLTNRLTVKFRGIDKVIVEKIKGRGGWHANSVFAMGFYYGQVVHEVVITKRPLEYVLPQTWTGIVHRNVEMIKGHNTAKEKSLRAYHMYFPHDPIGKSKGKDGYHDGLTDALLIACHGLIEMNYTLPRIKFSDWEEMKWG